MGGSNAEPADVRRQVGSRGLGLGLAAELRRRGWHVVATVRAAAGERRLRALGPDIRVERLDINDDPGIMALHGRLAGTLFDLIFVVAGIGPPTDHDSLRAGRDEAASVFMTNAVAPVRLARAFLDLVRDGRGVIAFMSSSLGSVADKTDNYAELYSASKAALNSLSRSLAASLGRRRVTVLAVSPGWVRTDMGGPGAPLSVDVSVAGIVDMLESRAGTGRRGFVDYRGREVAW